MARERVGVFGGTFDPPHVGHLIAALDARHALGLDRVLLVVNHIPWQKVGTRSISPAADRLAMVTEAVAGVDGLEASDVEIQAGGPSYTADTLETLLAQDPDRDLFVILGSDAAAGLLTWERAERVRDLATIVVVERPGVPSTEPLAGWRWERVAVPAIGVSSTDVRARTASSRPIDFLVPAGVAGCIARRGLYRDES